MIWGGVGGERERETETETERETEREREREREREIVFITNALSVEWKNPSCALITLDKYD